MSRLPFFSCLFGAALVLINTLSTTVTTMTLSRDFLHYYTTLLQFIGFNSGPFDGVGPPQLPFVCYSSGPWSLFLIGSYNVLDPPWSCFLQGVCLLFSHGFGFGLVGLTGFSLSGWVGFLFCFLWGCSLALCGRLIYWEVSWRLENLFSLLSPWWVCFVLGLEDGLGGNTLGVWHGCLKCSGKFLLGSGWDILVE